MRPIGLWALLGWMLISCGRATLSTPDAVFATQVPFRRLPGLRLEVLHIEKTFQVYHITLGLLNGSNEYVWFRAPLYGARTLLYSEVEGKWITLPDRVEALYQAEEILAPKGKGVFWFTFVNVAPELPPGVQPPVKVRVMVEGRIYRDGQPTEEAVGTYVEIVLPP